MRYCWEMDGDKRNGEVGQPEEFVKSWTRIYNIFQEDGANNVDLGVVRQRQHVQAPQPTPTALRLGVLPRRRVRRLGLGRRLQLGRLRPEQNPTAWAGPVAGIRRDLRRVHGLGPQHRPGAPVDDRRMDLSVTEFPRKQMAKPIMIGEYGARSPSAGYRHELHRSPYNTRRPGCGSRTTPSTAPSPGRRSATGAASTPTSPPWSTSTSWGLTGSGSSAPPRSPRRPTGKPAQDPWYNQIPTIGWARRPTAPRPAPDPEPTHPAARK